MNYSSIKYCVNNNPSCSKRSFSLDTLNPFENEEDILRLLKRKRTSSDDSIESNVKILCNYNQIDTKKLKEVPITNHFKKVKRSNVNHNIKHISLEKTSLSSNSLKALNKLFDKTKTIEEFGSDSGIAQSQRYTQNSQNVRHNSQEFRSSNTKESVTSSQDSTNFRTKTNSVKRKSSSFNSEIKILESMNNLLNQNLQENTNPIQLFFKNILNPKQKPDTVPQNVNTFDVKRYRKGKTKIYRIKKKIQYQNEKDMKLEDLFQNSNNDDLKSTSSSLVTDDAKSEVLSTGSKELTFPQQRLRTCINNAVKNKKFLYSQEIHGKPTDDSIDMIKLKIQEVVVNILEDFSNNPKPHIKVPKCSIENCIFKDERLQMKPENERLSTQIHYTAVRSEKKFCVMLYLLKLVWILLETDSKLSKREIYYQLRNYINNQSVIDNVINAISTILDVGPWSLNIISQCGIVYGNLKLKMLSGEVINCNVPGTPIPSDVNCITEIQSTAYFILVVEKEAIFLKLIDDDFCNKLTRPFLLITGKGFPDLNTQLFLKKLWMIMAIPVFILTDADPYGLQIMLNYKYGSVANVHLSRHLAVSNAKWLGVFPSEIIKYGIVKDKLTKKDLKLVQNLLNHPCVQNNEKIQNELNVFLKHKMKGEIEGLLKTTRYLSEVYLPIKFYKNDFV